MKLEFAEGFAGVEVEGLDRNWVLGALGAGFMVLGLWVCCPKVSCKSLEESLDAVNQEIW